MARQDLERQLLSGLLAVQRGWATPELVAAELAEACSQPDRGEGETGIRPQVVTPSVLSSVQQAVAEVLQQHGGDVTAGLRGSSLDPRLRQELARRNLPEINALLAWIGSSVPVEPGEFPTMAGDHYGTIQSKLIPEPPTAADPYTTGTNLPSAHAADSAVGTASGPVSVESGGRTEYDNYVNSAEVSAAVGPGGTWPDQPGQGEPPPDTSGPRSTSEDPSVVQEPDYTTLASGFPSGSPQVGINQFDAADIPWPLRFRVLREHAKGGLGKVSVAEDLELHREVAFKEIQHHMADDAEARTRFIQEAEITGGLEHPGIVPVYGLGTHPDGRPYYAMRFIRGRSLQQAIEDFLRLADAGADAGKQQFEFRHLLRRFIDVCNAIHYAHSRGIIHRDIKPGNVMLGDYGETLVVDWGIAKSIKVRGSVFRTALQRLPQLLAGDGSQTMMGSAIGTPQFMSPEQAAGRLNDLGPTSDVYSLGATLYCILCGTVAFTSRNLGEVLKQVKEGTFPPPIEVNPRVAKPLNAICVKAMATAAALRYETAQDLADDVEHWLADEPVVAYEENGWERLSRWVRRHQARAQAFGVAGVAIALVSIIAALLIEQSRRTETEAKRKLGIAHVQESVARQQEAQAKREALRRSQQTREAVDTLLAGVGDALDAVPGMQEARKRLLERAAQDYAKLTQESNSDPELQAEAARSLIRLADVRSQLNELDKAREALQKANEILQALIKQTGKQALYVLELARADTRRGLLESRAAKTGLARIHLLSAVTAMEDLVRSDSNSIDYQDALGTALLGLGKVEQQAAKPQDAGRHLKRALTLYQDLLKRHPNNVQVLTATAAAENSFARYLLDTGRAAEAVDMFNGVIQIHDVLVDDHPKDPDYFARRAAARIVLAEALRSLGRWAVVVANDEACVADLAIVVQARPDVPRYRQELAIARANLGQSLRKLGDNKAALPALEKSLATFVDLTISYPIPEYTEGAADVCSSLALVQSELGQQDAALAMIDTALGDYGELLALLPESASYQDDLGLAQVNRARIQARRNDAAGAVKGFEEAIATLKAAVDKDAKTPRYADHLAMAWTQLGQIHTAAGQSQPARDAFQSAITIRQDLVKNFKGSPLYQDSLAWLLATCPVEELRNAKEAVALSQLTTQLFPDSPQHWLTHGAGQLQLGDPASGLSSLDKSLNLRGRDEGLTLALKSIAAARLKQSDPAQKSLAAAQAWQQAQKPADEELARWIKQAEEAVGQK